MLKLKGLATGIGSLPHHNVDAALDLIFQYIPNIPFWPQLPKRDIREGMVAQFSENLPFLKIESSRYIKIGKLILLANGMNVWIVLKMKNGFLNF